MATDSRISPDLDATGLSQYTHSASRFLRGLILTVAVALWVGFWGLVVRLHLQMGDILAASVVSVLIVLPTVIGYLFYLRVQLRDLGS